MEEVEEILSVKETLQRLRSREKLGFLSIDGKPV